MKASNFLAGVAVCGAVALSAAMADASNADSTSTSVTIDGDQGE